jgi:hypothetical protein
MGRIILAAVLGGIMVFLWGAVSHMLLPTGMMGIQSLPNEEAVLPALKGSVTQPGLYFFPGMDMSRKPTAEEQAAWNAKYSAGPTGILVLAPVGVKPLAPALLIIELLTNIAAAFVLAWILARMLPSVATGGHIGALFGLFAWLSLSLSYWNWYKFPTPFIAAEAIDQIVGWLLGGLVIGFILRRRGVVVTT